MKKNKKKIGIMYSTNSNYEYKYENEEAITLKNNDQNLKVCIEKHRAGKISVIVKGFIGNSNDLKALGKKLKEKCGVGGSTKNGLIIIQGNIRDKVITILAKEGYNYKRVGG
tara:strand:+ start:3001 stop:3336 length:336 start_codon:yes stop_codon:yes gene_type:complete